MECYKQESHTSNAMPNTRIDTGVARRFRSYTHKSNLIDDETIIDPFNDIYFEDKHLINNLIESSLLYACFDILAMNSNKWLKGEKFVLTKANLEAIQLFQIVMIYL
jgi:hypothetical protein